QERIHAYAKKHNYEPSSIARVLSLGKTQTIGLIIPRISDGFYAKTAGFIEERAMEMGYTVVFSSSNENPRKESMLIRSMLNRHVDGLIIASTQRNHSEIQSLRENNFPFVLIDRHYPNVDTNYVIVDNFGGVNTITKHLIRLGRKRIGFISIKSELDAMVQRFNGYVEAIRYCQEYQNEPLMKFLNNSDYDSQMENELSDLYFSSKSIDGLVFSTHYLARAGIRALKKLDINIPGDVAITSFSESTDFDLIEPPITTVQQPIKDISVAALDILINELEGKKSLQTSNKQKVLDLKFSIRKSCGSKI
ncbi:MAG: substrate-binding domain-containing protein, partial [Flavobacteriaceae bacterium]|nr:substrate-binding domain-containing protein [Flavobacteriaceae bacterium]